MKKIYLISVCSLMAIAGLFGGCSNDDKSEPAPGWKPTPSEELKERQDIFLTPQQKVGVNLQNDFAFRLFNIDIASTDKNSLISPLSITQCVSMAANGASVGIRNEIVGNLLPEGGNLDDLNDLNKYLMEALSEVDNSSVFTLSNSVWIHNKYSLLPAFSNAIKEYYKAESGVLDMFSQSAADKINNWINSTTNGLIPKLYEEAPGYDIGLINTMYFKGAWTTEFEEKDTEKSLFINEDGKTTEIDFMKSRYTHRLVDINSAYTVTQLNYGNKAFSLYAILPAEGTTLILDAEKWGEIKEGMSKIDVDITLPKFEIEYMIEDMENKMKQAGMKELFTSGEAFVNTVTPKIAGSLVKIHHKTVFKVNEKGAEGTGLTEMGAITFGGEENISKTPSIVFNRPFIYIVEEQSTGAILFIGAVRNL